MREIEREQAHLAGNFRPSGPPAEASGDHEMKHEEQLAFGLHDDSFAQAPQASNRATDDRRQRRIDRAKEKRTGQPYGGDAVTDDPRLQRVEVQKDVRELGHDDDRIG